MKSYAVTAAIAAICVASTTAAKPNRKRVQQQHKSTAGSARVVHSDESFDPYLGMETRRRMAGHAGDHASDHSLSMSMSMSMPTEPTVTPPTDAAPTDGTSPTPAAAPTDRGIDTSEESGAMTIGTTVSVLAAAGAMMLL